MRPLVDALERRLLLSGTLPSFVQASTDANYTLDNSSGSMVMDLSSGSLVVNQDLSTATGWSNATVRLHNSAHIYFNSAQTLGDLELHNFSSAAVALGSTATSGNLLQLSGLSIDTWSKLDLGDNSMILHYAPSQQGTDNSMIFGLLANGYAGGTWNGHGIYSSAAANDSAQKTALGFGDNNVLHNSSFAGVSLTDYNEVLVRDTLYGDSNLDGVVADKTGDDAQFQKGLNGLGTGWSFGNYNYDSTTADSADASLLAANANQTISQSRYTPSLQVQPLSFTAYQYTPWSGDVATFTDSASRLSYAVSDYTATINWGGFVEDAQITQPSAGADYFRVNAQTSGLSNGPFTIQISYAAGGTYTGAPTNAVGMITALQLPSGAIPTSDSVYTLSGSPGAVSLNVTAGTIAFNTNVANSGNYWQNLTINASGTAHLIFNSAQTLDALNLSNSAVVTVSQGSSGTSGNVLQLDSLSVATTSTLDLGDNSLILAYAPGAESSAASLIQSLLASGYNNGAWNGPGINSSTAADDAAQSLSVGWMDNNVGWIDGNNAVQHDTSFANVNLPDFNQILVRSTLAGDANLDGVVDGTDLQQTSRGQSSLGTGWQYGDFNYNATAGDQGDFSIVSQNSGKAIAGSQYAPAFQLSLLTVQPYWNSPYIGDVATFTDTLNHNLPAGDYTADIYWGTGDLTVAQVYSTNTPGQFRINTYSPVLTGANSIMMVTVQYAGGSGQQGEPAIATEPIYVLQLPPGVNASADAVYSVGGLPGQVGLSLTAGSLTFDTNVSQSDGNYWKNFSFYVSGSAHAYFNAPEDFSNLQIVDNATVSVSRGSGGTNGNLLNVQQLSIDPGATLDLSDNGLIDWYDFANESAAAAQMQSWLRSGYNGGAWNGTGIISSVAANDTTHATGLGWMDNGFNYAAVGLDPSVSSFHGINLPTKDQLLVDFTYNGDANLNGQVDQTDVNLWHTGQQNREAGWVYGDFNYDSSINNTDFNIWNANYGLSANMANFPRAFQPAGIVINPIEGVAFSGDIATFKDLLNPGNTDPSIYVAQVNWGDATFATAQVTTTSTPGSFRINAVSPPLTDPNAVMTVTIKYADMNDPSPTYQGRPAAVSEPITMTPAVSNLTATAASTSEIDLTWTLNAPNAAAIEVDQSTDGTDWQTLADSLPGSTTSYADTSGLSEATHYFYRVSLIWSSGPSAFTITADAWTLPNGPSGLSAQVVGPNEIDLAWTNNSATATQFQIERSDDGTNFYLLDKVTGNAYADTLAADGSTSSYRVEALNDEGDASAPSNVTSATAALASPTDLTATAVSASEIDVTWQDASFTATNLKLERSTDDATFTPLSTNLPSDTSTYADTGLSAGTHYYYRVTSLAGSQSSAPSETADDTTIPPAPTGVSATAKSSTSVNLSWSAVQGAGGYEVDEKVGSDWVDLMEVPDATTTTFTDSSLLQNTNYSFQISAYNKAGTSSPTPVSASTPMGTPAAPSGLRAITLSPTSVQLVWTNNADNEQGFRIDKSDDGGFSWATLGSTDPGTTSYIDSGLQPGQTRLYEVVAYNSAGDSGVDGDSSSVTVTTPNLPTGSLVPPQPPTNLSAATTSTNLIQLQWTASPTPGVRYWVERHLPGGSNWGVIGITSATTYSDNPSLFNADFSYRVLAANAEYTSPGYAGPATAMKPYPVPGAPDVVQALEWQNGYHATISWTPASDLASLQGYDLSYTVNGVNTVLPLGADVHEYTITTAASADVVYSLTAYNQAGQSAAKTGDVHTKNDPYNGPTIQSASVDNQGNVTLVTSGGAVNNVEYTDDPTFSNWLGVVDGSSGTMTVPLGTHLWIRSFYGGEQPVALNIPALPQLGGLNEETDGADAYGDTTFAGLYYNWGPLAPQADAQMQISVDAGSFADFTSAGTSSGTQYEGPNIDGQPFEGGTYVAELRQMQKISSMPVTPGYSDWQSYDRMNAMPAAPLNVTATAISGGKVRLLWAEGSEGETQQTIKCLTGRNLDTLVSSTTVPAGTTTFDYGPLPAGSYAFEIMESNGDSSTSPMGASSRWTGSNAVNVSVTNTSVSPIQDATELGPDGQPQDGYFEVARGGTTDGSVTVDYTVDTSVPNAATPGVQYQPLSGSVTFDQGQSAVVVPVVPIDDGAVDGTAIVQAQLTPAAGVSIVGTGNMQVAIANSDQPPPSVTTNLPDYIVVGQPVMFTCVGLGPGLSYYASSSDKTLLTVQEIQFGSSTKKATGVAPGTVTIKVCDVHNNVLYSKQVMVVKMAIDPITPDNPDINGNRLNDIYNPAAIVIQDPNNIDGNQLARVILTEVAPASFNITANDPRIVWKVTSGAGGGQAVFYGETDPAVGHGWFVSLYGTQPGKIVITAYIDPGNNQPLAVLDTYEAVVVNLIKIPYRAQILTDSNGGGATATPDQVAKQIALANSLLFQMGVELVPDNNGYLAAGFTKAAAGIYTSSTQNSLAVDVTTGPRGNANGVISQNAFTDKDHPDRNSLQITYVGNITDSNDEPLLGAYIGGHDNPVANPKAINGSRQPVSMAYRIDAGDTPAGFPKPQTTYTMYVDTKGKVSIGNNGLKNWGIVVGSANATADLGAVGQANLQYAITIAHEVGHFLGLEHRDTPPKLRQIKNVFDESNSPWDGLSAPHDKNVMDTMVDNNGQPLNPAPYLMDFDLIQAAFVHGLL